jgi:hypothetical protein
MSSLAVVTGTTRALKEHLQDVFADRGLTSELLERIERHALLSAAVLQDLVRGLPPEVVGGLNRTIQLPK